MPTNSLPKTTAIRRVAPPLAPALVFGVGAATVALTHTDTRLFMQLQSLTTSLPDGFWAFVTDQASVASVAAWMGLGLLVWPRAAAAVLLSWPAGLVCVRGLKYALDAPRPQHLLPPESIHVVGINLDSLSFPSGHTATAFAVASALLWSLPAAQRARWLLPALAAALLVGISRIGVGAHWPVDVLAGAAIGWLCGLSGASWSRRWRFWQRRAGLLVLALMGIVAGVTRLFVDSGYPGVAGFASALGVAAIAVSTLAAFRFTQGQP